MTVTDTRMHHWMEPVQVLDVSLQDARQQLAMTAMTLMQRYIRERLISVIEKIMTVMELQPTALENPGMELPVMGLIQTSVKREPMDVQAVLRSVQTTRAIQQRSALVVWMRTVIRQLTVQILTATATLPVMGLIQTSAKRELMDVQAALRSVQTAREIQ